MMIVWGHNNFRLKSVDATELGIFDPAQGNYTFELRQKYAHIFWIPIFPLGKIWTVRRQGSKLMHCPPQLEAVLKERFPARTSVFAWTLPLLIIAGLVISSINEKMQKRRWEQQAKESFAAVNNSLADQVTHAKPNDYFLLSLKFSGNKDFEYRKFPLKVLAVSNDEIKFGKFFADIADAKPVDIKEDIAGIETSTDLKDSFTVSKADLRNAINNQYGNENDFAGVAISHFVTGATCQLKEIVHVEGPIVNEVALSDDKNDGKYFELENTGFNSYADSIVSTDKSITWKLSKKHSFYNGDTIAIKCSGPGDAILYCSDKQKKIYSYSISNTGYGSLEIKQRYSEKDHPQIIKSE